jgi:AdoMet-dependent heme synthase
MLSADEHEEVFAELYAASKHVHFQIKTTEGQHYQRYLLWQRVKESRGRLSEAEAIPCLPRGVNDGKGLVFISYRGEAFPAGTFHFPGGMSLGSRSARSTAILLIRLAAR